MSKPKKKVMRNKPFIYFFFLLQSLFNEYFFWFTKIPYYLLFYFKIFYQNIFKFINIRLNFHPLNFFLLFSINNNAHNHNYYWL